MTKYLLLLLAMMIGWGAHAQLQCTADTSQTEVKMAVHFLGRYLDEFKDRKNPDYIAYWCAEDCKRSALPDYMAYSITTDGATYNFVKRPVVFYAKVYKGYVHLKTLFATTDSAGGSNVCAITNHYIRLGVKPCFVSELELHKSLYAVKQVGNICYHYPKTHVFNQAKASGLAAKLKRIEQEWGFKPVKLDYYFADNRDGLVHMQGMDYCWGMDGTEPSGMSFPEANSIFCQGMGEGYLHEILHQYFNPLYLSSPVCHGLVYYLGGGLGHDFDWMIRRMNVYLQTYPELDLTDYQNIFPKDKMLHIDHVVNGLLCKMVYEKEGVKGLRRILAYKTTDEIFEKEFGVAGKDKTVFLRGKFAVYSKEGK